MKRPDLHEKTIKFLKAKAFKLGIKRPTITHKDDLISEILLAEKIRKLKAIGVKKKNPASKSSSNRTATKRAASVARIRRLKQKDAHPSPSPETPFEHKFDTPAHPPLSREASSYDNLGELQDAYDTGRLFMTARDPHWLYAYWDYSWQRMEGLRQSALNRELKLRVYTGTPPEVSLHQEITLHSNFCNYFIHVGKANAHYHAEFGYYDPQGIFIEIARSRLVQTPPDCVSDHTEVRFVTIPFHLSFAQLFEMIRNYQKEGEELADVLHRLQAAGFNFPFDYPRGFEWSAEQDRLISQLFGKNMLSHSSSEMASRIRIASSSPHYPASLPKARS